MSLSHNCAVLGLLLVGLLLGGCASARYREAEEKSRAATADCRTKRLAGELSSREASARCSEPKIRAAFTAAGYPYMDLIELHLAHRLLNAQKVDRGEISEDQARLNNAEVISRINGEIARRDAMATPPVYPGPVVCTRIGTTVFCQ
jgi:hypothetical protein